MKRFHFRLERVLKLKRERERMAELRVHEARLALDAAHTAVRTLVDELKAAAERLRVGVGMTLTDWLSFSSFSSQRTKALLLAEQEAGRAEQRFHDAVKMKTALATETETLLHLRTQAWDLHREEAAVDEQRRLDELGLRRWQAARPQDESARQAPGEDQL